MPVSDPDVSRPRLVRDATFLEADRREIALRRGSHNRLGFAYQVAFVRVLGRFPRQAPLEIDGEILRFAALQLGADAETIHAYARRQQTVSAHQRRIGQYLRLRTFDTAAGERLARFLEDEALRLDRTGSLLARARGWLRDEHVLAPADSALRRAVGGARQKARALLTQRMAERLSASMRDRLDALVAVGDDDPHSPLHHIKTSSSNPSVGRRAVNFRLIAEQWDRIGQFYAAFPAGHAMASAALQRLNRFQASNRFYAANRELGRALKTEFVLQYMSEPQLRAKVRRGLLKVEQLHALARAVYYGQRGRISAREVYDQVNACSCLTLILACIVYWQAREISRLAAAPDFPFDPGLLRHVSPIEWKNIVLYGEIKIDPAKLKMRRP